ncbi:MAG: tyrosine-type recombinase/integrase [Promethearchaeota archaeon]
MACEIFTVKELAEYLSLSTGQIYNLVAKRELQFTKKKGVGLRFRKKDVDEWLDKGKCPNYEVVKNLNFPVDLSGEKDDVIGRRLRMKGSRGYGDGFVFPRKTSKGITRWYINYYVGENGNRKRVERIVKNAVTRQDAIVALKEQNRKQFNQQNNVTEFKKDITFKELTGQYLELHAKEKRSFNQYEGKINSRLNPFFGNMRLAEITPLDVEKYIAHRKQNGKGKNGNGTPDAQTINWELSLLRTIYNWAIKSRKFIVNENPVIHKDHFKKTDGSRERILSYQEEKILMKQLKDWQRDIVQVALNTGMRKGEIEKLKVDDLDFENNAILIRTENNKSKRDDIIPMNTIVQSILRKSINGKSEFVFTHYNQKTRTHSPVKNSDKWFRAACRKVCIEDLQFRDLRTTFATRAATIVNPFILQKLMRHTDIRLTQKFYVKVDQQLLQDGVEKLVNARKNGGNGQNQLNNSGISPSSKIQQSPNSVYLQ